MQEGCPNPWLIWHEEVIGGLLAQVNDALNERNVCMPAFNAKSRLRTRVSPNARNWRNKQTSALEVHLVGARARFRDVRKEVKGFLRQFEKKMVGEKDRGVKGSMWQGKDWGYVQVSKHY